MSLLFGFVEYIEPPLLHAYLDVMVEAFSVLDIVKYVIKLKSLPEEGKFITNLKLQKILYYIQGFHVAFLNRPLFDEKISALQFGPVVKKVYDRYCKYGSNYIDEKYDDFDPISIGLSPSQIYLIQSVCHKYGDFSAFTLVNMTHNESPWIRASHGGSKIGWNVDITNDMLKDFFDYHMSSII